METVNASDQSVDPWGSTGASGQISTGTANPWTGSGSLLVQPAPQVAQQDIQSKAIASNLIGTATLQLAGPVGIIVPLATGFEVVIQNVTSNDPNQRIVGSTEWSIFVDTPIGANLLPGGSNVVESQWQVIGPITSYIAVVTDVNTTPPIVSGEESDGLMQIEYVYIANNTGLAHDLVVLNKSRYISNVGSPATV